VSTGNLIKKVQPAYPHGTTASGLVTLRVVIDVHGNVVSITPESGPEALFKAAAAAVWKWQYRPYVLNGQPVAVDTTVNVMFGR
jgi:protein TonB